jgi:pimeloyl-ACP methyl ester carboxylesterase
MAAIHAPLRVEAVILEALHHFAAKPRSRSFFQRMAFEPESFSEGIRRTLAVEHGEHRWSDTVRHDGQAWLGLARGAASSRTDLYGGRLHEISRPVLVVHGGCDPRTEPGELETILDALPDARLSFHAEAGHCPHAEASGDAVTRAVVEFLGSLVAKRGSEES